MQKNNLMFPLSSPFHNIREVCKQMTLLEDHLNQNAKRCPDCIGKHFLSIEAYLDEAISLASNARLSSSLEPFISRVVFLQRAWAAGKNPLNIALEVRKMRKRLSPHCFSSGGALPSPDLGTLTGDVGFFSPEGGGQKALLQIFVAGLGLYFGYFLVDKFGTGGRG